MTWIGESSRNLTSGNVDWDEVRKQRGALESSQFDEIRANAPKITPVKEGQQYPVGKHGQYKLFHEHQWPKGYTPERLEQVRDATAGWVNIAHESDDTGQEQRLRSQIPEHLARSTMPIENIRVLNENVGIEVNPHYRNAGGEYSSAFRQITLGTHSGFRNEGHNKTVENQLLIHELGHAYDDLSDTTKYTDRNMNSAYKSEHGTLFANPNLEGIAEGHRIALTRVTRSMQRHNWLGAAAKYSEDQWVEPQDKAQFSLSRLKAFRFFSGQDPYPKKADVTETPKTEQPTLPGMEKYMKPSDG